MFVFIDIIAVMQYNNHIKIRGVKITEKKKIKWLVLLIIAAIVFAVALIALIIHLLPDDIDPVSSTPPPVSSSSSVSEVVPVENPINFAELQAQNPDICAWIKIPGMVIDYPILQSAEDAKEDYYLDHNEKRKSTAAGAIYIQKVNKKDFSDPNTLIYGHNMLNGSMFATLKKFRNAAFFEENQYINIYTPGHILTYHIFSAFVYDSRHIWYSFNYFDEQGYASFLEQSLNPKSMVKNVRAGVSVTTDDQIITLSTCTGNDAERYLVEGVLVSDQRTN